MLNVDCGLFIEGLGVVGPQEDLRPTFECHQDSCGSSVFLSALASLFFEIQMGFFPSKSLLAGINLNLNRLPFPVLRFWDKDTEWLSVSHVPAYRPIG